MKYDLMEYDIAKVKQQFPAFLKQDAKGFPIYLDNPAGTQISHFVLERMQEALVDKNANLGGYFKSSIEAGELVSHAHDWVADFFNASSPKEIIFGQSMTSLTFGLSRSIGRGLKAGDEIILSRSDHDGNVAPWLMLAEEKELVVRWLDLNPHSFEYDIATLEAALSPLTKLVVANYANNLTGTINDVKTICRLAKSVGAISYIDAVQFAPHGIMDVQDLDCDFMICSAYKFYGPHYGVLYGRQAVLEKLTAYKVRANSNDLPFKFVNGTTNREQLAGIVGALQHFEWMGNEFKESDPSKNAVGRNPRQASMRQGIVVMQRQDQVLSKQLISGLKAIKGLKIIGIENEEDFERRVSTVSFIQDSISPHEVAKFMASKGIYIWSGHNYGLETVNRLGLMSKGGVVRVGPTHYNSIQDIDYFLEYYHAFLKEHKL